MGSQIGVDRLSGMARSFSTWPSCRLVSASVASSASERRYACSAACQLPLLFQCATILDPDIRERWIKRQRCAISRFALSPEPLRVDRVAAPQ